MTKLSKENFLKKIQETNEIFNNSTPEQKRVMIAKDVIERLELRMLVAWKGCIIKALESSVGTPIDVPINQHNVNNLTCEVCAKGGLLASYVGRVNNYDFIRSHNNFDSNPEHRKLLEVFSIEQLALIEAAFEGCFYLENVKFKDDDLMKALSFFNAYAYDANERLIAICENIIKNNGEFVL